MMVSTSCLEPSVPASEARWPLLRSLTATGNSALFKFRPLWDSVICRDLGKVPKGNERGGKRLIKLTRINGDSVTVNSDLIMFVETAGETTITLSNGERMKVREDVDRLCCLVLEFKRAVFDGSLALHQPECGS